MPTRISTPALRSRLASTDPPVLVEALGAGFYADAHLPGAINVPRGQVDGLAPVLLPDRAAEIVVYCTRSGTSSDAVGRRLEELGYTTVAIYTGGKEDWVEHGLPVDRIDAEADQRLHASRVTGARKSATTPSDEHSVDDLTATTTATRETPMTATDTKTIAFVLYPGLTPLDLVGPLQALSPLPRIDPTFDVVVVGDTTDVLPTDSVIQLAPSHTFDEVQDPFAIVVPGGGQPTLAACGNRRLIDYVMTADAAAEVVMSVCTGAIILASAGLLDDRPATTHWAYVDILEGLGAKYLHQRWVEDGKYLTTAGVSAGIDGGLHLAARLVGADAAKLIQRGMEYEPQPPFGPVDWDPAVVESLRPIWRGPLTEELARHPHLAREARLGRRPKRS